MSKWVCEDCYNKIEAESKILTIPNITESPCVFCGKLANWLVVIQEYLKIEYEGDANKLMAELLRLLSLPETRIDKLTLKKYPPIADANFPNREIKILFYSKIEE